MRAEPEPEFTAYVRARHHELLASAVLVLGDRPRAEALVRACLVALAARWESIGGEDPDAWVRARLHREALALARRQRGRAGWTAEPAVDLWTSVRALPPGQRSALVLTRLERRSAARAAAVLGVPPVRLRADADAAEARLRRRLPGLSPGELELDLAELAARLTPAGPGTPQDAWQAAVAASRRRHRLAAALVAGVVLAAGIAAAVHTVGGGGASPAGTAASPTTPASPGTPPEGSGSGSGTVVRERVEAADGTTYTFVRGGSLARLATAGPGRGLLPRDLTPPPEVPPLAGVVAVAGGRARAVALALRPAPGGFRPLVLVVAAPGTAATPRWGAVDRVLPAPDPVLGAPPAGSRSISLDGSWVGFVGADRAVVLDVRTGRLRDVVVPPEFAPGPPLASGAWSDSGAFWVWSAAATYRLPGGAGSLERVATDSRPDRVSLVNAGELRGGSGLDTTIARYDREGRLTASTEAGGQLELVGSAVATSGWVVRGAHAPRGLGLLSAVVAVRTDGSGDRKLLGMDERADGAVLGGLTAAGTVPSAPDVVVLRYGTGRGRTGWVTWDLASDEVRLLATGDVVAVRLRAT